MAGIALTVGLVAAAAIAWFGLKGVGGRRADRVQSAAEKAVRRRLDEDNRD